MCTLQGGEEEGKDKEAAAADDGPGISGGEGEEEIKVSHFVHSLIILQ